MCRSPWGRRVGQTDRLNRPCPIYHSLHIHATHCHQGAPGATSTRSSLHKRKSRAQESHGAAPPVPIPTHPRTSTRTNLFLSSALLLTSLPILPEPTSLTRTQLFRLWQKYPLPTISTGGGAPPEVCTAPWRPPTQLESLGSPLPAGPPGSAGPAVAAAPHLPRVGRESSFRGTVRASLPGPESPAGPACYSAPKPACNGEGGPDTTWPAVPSTSHWAISCHY